MGFWNDNCNRQASQVKSSQVSQQDKDRLGMNEFFKENFKKNWDFDESGGNRPGQKGAQYRLLILESKSEVILP